MLNCEAGCIYIFLQLHPFISFASDFVYKSLCCFKNCRLRFGYWANHQESTNKIFQ